MSLPVPAAQTHLAHPKYRADIDGLRAIAVLSVIGFHAFPLWIQGGFIGVDIFFVISGFLISSIIFDNLERDNFSFVEFYSRRINRIFPALLVVPAASFLLGWFVLFPDEYKQLGKHIAGGAGFVSNFILSNESGYFDNSATRKPLLHLWSLGIEEQFYIVWPLLLAFVWKRKWRFVTITATIAVASFTFNIYAINTNQAVAFYSPFSRFWELMTGGLLAYISLHKPGLAERRNNAQSIMGCMLIASGLVFLDKARAFPGWWALLPVMGAFLLISAGPKAWFNRHVLANKWLVWVGLISYPLYLWHWPLLSFTRIVAGGIPPRVIRIAAILVSIALAWLTYRLVERPIRFGQHRGTKVAVLCVLMMTIGYSGFYTHQQDGLNARNNFEKVQDLLPLPFENYKYNGCYMGSFHLSHCKIPPNNAPTVAIYGDSHAGAHFPGIVELDERNNWLLIEHNSCPPIVGIEIASSSGHRLNCQRKSEEALSILLNTPSIHTVVIAFYGKKYISDIAYQFHLPGYGSIANKAGLFYLGLEAAVNALEQNGKSVIIVIDVPDHPFFPRDCINRTALFGVNNSCELKTSVALESQKGLREILSKLAKAHPEVRLYDSFNSFCDKDNCNFENDEMLFYRDPNHLSTRGSLFFAKDFLNWMANTPID